MAIDSLGLTDRGLLQRDLFVDGQWVPASDGARVDVLNPATGAVVDSVASATLDDTRRAIRAAEGAFGPWSHTPAKERSRILRIWHDLLLANADDLARIMTAEQGKPLSEARGEILFGAAYIEWYAEEGKRAGGDVIPTNMDDRELFALSQPVGVCAAITPWNFPMAMIARKVGPALAAGCTMVLKPATETPFSALALAELGRRAGLPAGVFNVVHGAPEVVGGELAKSPIVRKLTFTGSTRVGRLLMAQCASTVKNLSLELGGNAPLIVFDDADLDAAVDGAIASKFRNAGQTCVCANRILVQDGIHDAFVERFAAAAAALRIGPGTEDGVEQGPLINEAGVAKVEDHVRDAVALGATVVTGGSRHPHGSNFFTPTVLVGVTPDMLIAREETFGPIAPILRFSSEADAVALANDVEAGLAAYLFTKDSGRIWRVTRALEVGVVSVNTGIFSYEGAPFGGVKQSGLGREGWRDGLDEYLETKFVCLAGVR